jgi:hypothetical protein
MNKKQKKSMLQMTGLWVLQQYGHKMFFERDMFGHPKWIIENFDNEIVVTLPCKTIYLNGDETECKVEYHITRKGRIYQSLC